MWFLWGFHAYTKIYGVLSRLAFTLLRFDRTLWTSKERTFYISSTFICVHGFACSALMHIRNIVKFYEYANRGCWPLNLHVGTKHGWELIRDSFVRYKWIAIHCIGSEQTGFMKWVALSVDCNSFTFISKLYLAQMLAFSLVTSLGHMLEHVSLEGLMIKLSFSLLTSLKDATESTKKSTHVQAPEQAPIEPKS